MGARKVEIFSAKEPADGNDTAQGNDERNVS
jgi:hypothetical protein